MGLCAPRAGCGMPPVALGRNNARGGTRRALSHGNKVRTSPVQSWPCGHRSLCSRMVPERALRAENSACTLSDRVDDKRPCRYRGCRGEHKDYRHSSINTCTGEPPQGTPYFLFLIKARRDILVEFHKNQN